MFLLFSQGAPFDEKFEKCAVFSVILLLSGICCFWKVNYENVVGRLTEHFRVGIAAYSGFDEECDDEFRSMQEETEKLEQYIKDHYNNKICAPTVAL